MTNEEAKDLLDNLIGMVSDNQESDYDTALIMGIKALEQEKEPILDKIRAEIDRQEKWLLQAGYNAYNVDIAFDAIKSVVAESEG